VRFSADLRAAHACPHPVDSLLDYSLHSLEYGFSGWTTAGNSNFSRSSFVSRGKIQKARWTETIDDGMGEDCSKGSSVKAARASASMMKIRPQVVSPSIRQIEFPPTVEADLVCAVFDREYSANMTVAAAENKLEDTDEQFHKSCARWRRSQLPFASNHSSKDRTLARAKAIAQSAAP